MLQRRTLDGATSLPVAVQPKILIGPIDDPLEHEADHVADQATHMPSAKISISARPPQNSLKCAGCEQDVKLQQKAAGAQADAGATSIVHQVLGTTGRPLDAPTRAYFEPRFGYDFSQVRVHVGFEAEQSARVMSAQAYTVGHDIVFGAGRFTPTTHEGRRLIAHELTHVVQQGGNGTILQRGPGDIAGADDQPTAFAVFVADERRRGDKRYARRLGGADAARLRKAGALSVDDRQELNAKLRFFEGDAKEAYIQEIRPALREVARVGRTHEIEMPKEYVGSDKGPKRVRLLSLDYSGPEVCGGQPCVTDAEIYADLERSRADNAAAEAKATAERKRRAEIGRHGTKQQKWELDFEIQYSQLKNVGARVGPRDAGIMTETGVRVPRDPKDFLAPRPFYERRDAAFLAWQGFIHYAEIVEAGHDAAAREMALQRNGGFPIPDDRLDLYAYTHWSRKAVASRKGAELGLLVANVVFAVEDVAAALAKRRTGPAPPVSQLVQGLSDDARLALQRLGVAADDIEQFTNGAKVWGAVSRGNAKLVPYFQREGQRLTAGILGAHAHLDRAGMIRAYLTFRQESMALAKQLDAKILRLEADVVTNTDELLPELLARGYREIEDRPFSYFLEVPVQ
jgi:hypothetical protein